MCFVPAPPPSPAQVAVNYASSPDKAEEVAAEIAKLGGEAMTIGCNVAKREELDAMFKAVTDKWGQVDVLVNNAGVCGWMCVCVGGQGQPRLKSSAHMM